MIVDLTASLRGFLIADTTIAALTAQRVYSALMPQANLLPCLVLNTVSADGDYTMDGPSGLRRVRVQIDSYSRDQETARQAADRVEFRLDGFRGNMASLLGVGAVCQGAFFADRRAMEYDEATKWFRDGRDYYIWYSAR